MGPYSMDLRRRVAEAVDNQEASSVWANCSRTSPT